MRSGAIDTVQVIYNVFHQQPEKQFLTACQENGVGVIVRMAVDEGGLTRRVTADSRFEGGDFRARYFAGDRPAKVEQHVQALVDDLGVDTDDLPGVALQYVLTNPAVSTVIAGCGRSGTRRRTTAATSLPSSSRHFARHRCERN